MPDTDVKELASFTLCYIQYLTNNGITDAKQIDRRLVSLTIQSQRHFVSRTSVLDLKTINGTTYDISTATELEVFMKSLYDLCNKSDVNTFSELLKKYHPDSQICKLCPYGVHYTQDYYEDELRLANYMLDDVSNLSSIYEKYNSSELKKIFRSHVDLYDILPEGSSSIIFNGLYLLLDAFYRDSIYMMMMDDCPSVFVDSLNSIGIGKELLNVDGKYAESVDLIYHYLLENIHSVEEPISDSEAAFSLAEKLLHRPAYTPVIDADATPILSRQIDTAHGVKRKEDDELVVIHENSKDEFIKKRKKIYDVVNARSYERDVFEEFDEYVEDISSDNDTDVQKELFTTVSVLDDEFIELTKFSDDGQDVENEETLYSGEVVDKDGKLVDPNLLQNQMSKMDDDFDDDLSEDVECDFDDDFADSFSGNSQNGFSWAETSASTSMYPEHEAKQDDIKGLPQLLSVKDFLAYEYITDFSDVKLLPEFFSEPLERELDQAQSLFLNCGYCIMEPVKCDTGIKIALYAEGSCFLASLPAAFRITHFNRIKKASIKPYLLYAAYAELNKKETHTYIANYKLKQVIPLLDIAKARNNNAYTSVPALLLERMRYAYQLFQTIHKVAMTEKECELCHLVSALGYNYHRERFLKSVPLNCKKELFSFSQEYEIIPNSLDMKSIIPIDDTFVCFKVYFWDNQQKANALYQKITELIFSFLDKRGDIRSLPFSILSFDLRVGEIGICASEYCYRYIRTLLMIYPDYISHKLGIKNLWMDIETF